MPLLGHAGLPQKKQFSIRILTVGTYGAGFAGCRGFTGRAHNLSAGGVVDAGLDGPEKN